MALIQTCDNKEYLHKLFTQLSVNLAPVTQEEEVKYKHDEQLKLLQDREYRYTHNYGVPKAYFMSRLKDLGDIKSVVTGAINLRDNSPISYSLFKGFIDNIKVGKRCFLWLCGTPGTGKTTLAAAVIHELCLEGVSCKYYKCHEVIQRLEDSKKYSSRDTMSSVMDEVCGVRFLVLNEVGRYPDITIENYHLFNIVNRLYENYCEGIFITNEEYSDMAQLLDRIGMPIADRFLDISAIISFSGHTFRGTKGELYTGENRR